MHWCLVVLAYTAYLAPSVLGRHDAMESVAFVSVLDEVLKKVQKAPGWNSEFEASPYTEDGETQDEESSDEDPDDPDADLLPTSHPLHIRCSEDTGDSTTFVVEKRNGWVNLAVLPEAHHCGDRLSKKKVLVCATRWELLVRLPCRYWIDAAKVPIPTEVIRDEFETDGEILVGRWDRIRSKHSLPKLGPAPSQEWKLAAMQIIVQTRLSRRNTQAILQSIPVAVSCSVGDCDTCETCDGVEIGELKLAVPARMKRRIHQLERNGDQHEFAIVAEGAAKFLLQTSSQEFKKQRKTN